MQGILARLPDIEEDEGIRGKKEEEILREVSTRTYAKYVGQRKRLLW